MKVKDLFEELTPNQMSEEEQRQLVSDMPAAIRKIKNPSEAVQRIACRANGSYIHEIMRKGIKPSKEVITTALTNDNMLELARTEIYDDIVKQLFPTSSLLVNKWIKYGDFMRRRLRQTMENSLKDLKF